MTNLAIAIVDILSLQFFFQSRVKLGVHEESGEQVAVKIMDKSDIKAQEMTMNVRREIAIMKALKHRNIVNLRQVLTSQSKLYIVMDLVTGGELFTKILNEGKLEESVARRYFQQLVDGIEYCHRRGVCHRDLKPENLLIDETTGELKITDFGLSAMRGASTTEELLHTQCGSPNYCAPEIIARHKQGYSGNKVDAWSCGIILFALLAGFLPFYDENTKVLYRMIQRDEVKFPKKFPPDARDLVLRLLHKEPEKRYTLAEVKKHPWFAVDYEGDDAIPRSTGSGTSPPTSRRKRRGHSRKSSVDQAPRSRDMAPRKKSDKSERDNVGPSGATASSAASQPVAHVMPIPPAITDNVPRPVPVAHRPPAPPVVSSSKPRSPLPMARQQLSATPPVLVPPSSQQPPLPPPPSSTVLPPPPPTYVSAAAARSVPPYSASRAAQRVNRDYRASNSNDQTSVGGAEPVQYNVVVNNGDVGNAGPPHYLQQSILPHPSLPPFPAPEARAENTGALSSPALQPNGRYEHNPNGIPSSTLVPPPPLSRPVAPNGDLLHTKLPLMNTGGAEYQRRPSGEFSAQPGAGVAAASESGLVSSTQNISPTDDGAFSRSRSPQKVNRSKWKVSGPTPPPSYCQSTMTPVTTPLAVASGDDSWMKVSKNKADGKADPSRTVKFNTTQVENGTKSNEFSETSTKPLSIVAQRRLLYNKLATDSDVPPPLPDSTFTAAPSTKDPSVSSRTEPTSAPLTRLNDRTETPVLSRYPTANDKEGNGHQPLSSVPNVHQHQKTGKQYINSPIPASQVRSDFIGGLENDKEIIQSVSGSRGKVKYSDEHDEVFEEESQVEHEGDTSMNTSTDTGTKVLPDDDADVAPIKRRLAAALARYRRIFKLGNNIGITASPSFSSNKGSGFSEGNAEDDKKPQSSRAEFFARAKAITGAWGIILTQELEEDSDSDDEAFQVTENELQAFSRLLDFWDNRRASATVPDGSEVLLDDEETSPLSEDDILSIQSLLHKLEPKQVEEEMKEVSEAEDNDLSQEASIYSQLAAPGHTDSTNYITADGNENSYTEDLVGHSSGRSVRSDASSRVHGQSTKSARTGRSLPVVANPPHEPAPSSPPPPPPPPMPRSSVLVNPHSTSAPPPPPPMPPRPTAGPTVWWNGGAVAASVPLSSLPPPPPPPPPSSKHPIAVLDSTRQAPAPPPPPPYAAPVPPVETEKRRMVVTQSTVRDPFRPKPPPSYPPPLSPEKGPVIPIDNNDETKSNAAVETNAAVGVGARAPRKHSRETESSIAAKRKSSVTASDAEAEARKTLSQDSGGRLNSVVSATSDGSGSGAGHKSGHRRSPSRDEHATRGMFSFGMFSRRKSSPLTSFDSSLPPNRCLRLMGRTLTDMGCVVLMKRGETKMKCEVPMKQEKLLVSITCTQERRVSTVHFKRGRKDRSQIDAKEFYDFFQDVQSRFQDQVASEAQTH